MSALVIGPGGAPSLIDAPLTERTAPLVNFQVTLGQFVRENFSDLAASVKIHEKVEMGDPVKNVVEFAKKEKTDMIIICTHGRTGLAHMLMGSNRKGGAQLTLPRSLRSSGTREKGGSVISKE